MLHNVEYVDLRIRAGAVVDEAFDLKAESGPAEFAIAAAEGEGKKIPTFNMTAYTGGAMHPGGWYRQEPVVVDLEGMQIPSQTIPIDHNHVTIVGHSTSIEKTPGQMRLKVSGVLSGHHESADHGPAKASREIVHLAGNGFPYQASIDAHISRIERIDAGDTVKVNGQLFQGPVSVARASKLLGVAILVGAADGNTKTTIAAQKGNPNMKFEEWLQARGIELTKISDDQRKLLAADFAKATPTNPATPATPTTIDEIVAAQRAENDRRDKIGGLVAESMRNNPANMDAIEAIGRLAIESRWEVNRVELELLRAGRPNGPTFHASAQRITGDVIEAAVCNYSKLPDVEKRFSEQTLEAAHKQFRNGLSLLDMIGIYARQNGWRGVSVKSDLRAACRAAFRESDQRIQAEGPSTYSVSGILSNVANKFLRIGFDSVESAWRQISAIRSVQDFKQITSYTLTGDLTYEQVAPGGEIQHGTLGETTYSNRADTYAKMLGIDRRDLINDDLGAFTSAGRRLGRGGALKLNTVFWGVFLDDSTFFPTDKSKNNYDDGATDSVLTATGLDNATTIFRQQTDPDGNPLGSRPRILLVPVTLEGPALTLMKSESLNLVTATTATTGQGNIWMGRYQVVSSDYLAGSSDILKAWYLLADPNDLPVIEVCFLNGVEMPTVETADMDFDRLGIVLRGFHDFGATKQEYRGGVKMKGQA